MAELVDLTLCQSSDRVRRRSISAIELVEATLQRIAETEPLIHAYTVVLADQARAAAHEADHEIGKGHFRGPLHGIPIGVKDLYYTRGIPTEAGSRALAGFVPDHDAAAVRRLREAGAIIIGKTVTHEFAYGVNTPPTRSPWGRDSYPGGSSAGSGAALAARSAFGALGTDTGGSIREPAALNGVVGIKPTYGLVGRSGVVPLSPSLDHAGPMARTVEDCALLLQAIACYDPDDSGSQRVTPVDYSAHLDESIAGLTIGVERGYFFRAQVRQEVRDAVERVIDELAQEGARIVEITIPELECMNTIGVTIMLADASAIHRRTLREHGDLLDPATRLMLELGELVPATHYITALRARALVRDAVRRQFVAHGLDALLSPTVPAATMPVDRVLAPDESGEDPMSAALKYMIPANITGQPAITVPCGFSPAGLPIGFQLMGRPFAEQTLFRLARAYERRHDWADAKPEIDEAGD